MANKTVTLFSNKSATQATDFSFGMTLADVSTKIDEALPENAVISNIKLQFQCTATTTGITFANVDTFVSLTNSDSHISSANATQILQVRYTTDDGAQTPDDKDVTTYFNSTDPYSARNTSYTRLSVYFDTSNIKTKTFTCNYLRLYITYDIPHTHSYTSKVTTPATCTSTGVRTYTCSCGHSYTESIPALGHSYGSPTYTWSSDGKTCTAKRVCSTNSSHTETATATITSAVKTAATCTAKGTTRYTAKFSDSWATTQTKDVQDIAAKGHSWVAATCTAPKTCSVCGATEGSALGHSYTSKVTPPTETASGYTTHTCSRCGHSYKDNYTALITVNCDTEMGTVEGGGTYNHGDTVSLFAMANEGYEFVRWSDGVEYDLRSITVTGSATYTAIFEKIPPPEITSVQMLYSNKQISAANKVPAGEFFRIVVGAVAYDS